MGRLEILKFRDGKFGNPSFGCWRFGLEDPPSVPVNVLTESLIIEFSLCHPISLIAPCDNCAAPYGFKNVMALSKDTRFFSVSQANLE